MKLRNYLLIGLALCAVACGRKGQGGSAAEEDTVPPPLGFYTERYSADTTEVRSGDTFSVLMHRLGMSNADAYTLSNLCSKDVFDLRKLRAGKHLHAYYEDSDSSRILRYVVYEQDRIRSTVFQCSDSLAI